MFQFRIAGGLDADQDKIDGTDLLGGSAGMDRALLKVAVRAADLNAMLLQVGKIPPGQEGDRHAPLGQFGSVIHPKCPCSDDSGFRR